jgi:poly-gamma-glutamate synthesis protein (capsule biosynthesis protein)
MLSSWLIPILAEQGADYPFVATRKYLASGDLCIANLEAPFTEGGTPFQKKYNFKVPPPYVTGLKTAGIDIVNLANNHTMDYGAHGLRRTIETLDSAGIGYCGAGDNIATASQPFVATVRGKKIAFFGYSMTYPLEFATQGDSAGTVYPEPELLKRSLNLWNDRVDLTVVSFHWGAEKYQTPKEYQLEFARLAIDNGADLILGHHSHVLQGLELYRNRLIAYSLGNYAFASYSEDARDSIILKVLLSADGLMYARCFPINVYNQEVEFQPRALDGMRGSEVIQKLQSLSMPLNGGRQIIADSGLIVGKWAEAQGGSAVTATEP